jgi:hypothetical protein
MISTVLIAVCSTLSVVAVVYLFVAMFVGLRRTVKKDRYYSDLKSTDQRFNTLDDELRGRMNTIVSDFDRNLYQLELKVGRDYDGLRSELKALRKTIDSRCDKLEYRFLKEHGTNLSELEEKLLEQ